MQSRMTGKSLERRVARRASRKKESRRRSELRFRRLFETAKDGILIVDARTHEILETNPCLLELLGLKAAQLKGRTLTEAGLVDDEAAEQQIYSKLEAGETVRFEHAVGGEKARVLEFLCNRYEEKRRWLVQCNIRDIADRKENERQLREVLQQLAAAKEDLEARVIARTADLQERNAELEAFSYSLSHDLRAPIRAIVSFTQLALEELGPSPPGAANEYLEKVISSAKRLDRLILDVLAFSRTTRQKPKPENVDVEQLIREILQERPDWNPPRAEITIESPLLAVRADKASLTQCLTNLLDNAVKFVPPSVLPSIRIATESLGSRVVLCVTDNGIGIPESAQSRIFDLFQKAHSGYGGYGIGLAIVRRAADRMQATVSVRSVPGQGSTFCIDLPAAVPPPEVGSLAA